MQSALAKSTMRDSTDGAMPLVKASFLLAEVLRQENRIPDSTTSSKARNFLQENNCIGQWNKFHPCWQPMGGNLLYAAGSWTLLLMERGLIGKEGTKMRENIAKDVDFLMEE